MAWRPVLFYVVPFALGTNINNILEQTAPVSFNSQLFIKLNELGAVAWATAIFAGDYNHPSHGFLRELVCSPIKL